MKDRVIIPVLRDFLLSYNNPMKKTLIALLVCMTTYSQTINWLNFNYPPIYITSRPNKGLGFGDKHQNMLEDCLEQYTHKKTQALSFARIRAFLESKKGNHCIAALGGFPNEISDSFYSSTVFTIPTSFIVTRRDTLEKLKLENDAISLSKLMNNKELKGAHVKGGTYGEAVSRILNTSQSQLLMKTDPDPIKFYKMLLRKRFDYALDYPIGLMYNIRALTQEQREKIAFVLIKENQQTPYINAYAICNKAPGSEIIINRINQCMKREVHNEKLRGEILKYIPDKMKETIDKINRL